LYERFPETFLVAEEDGEIVGYIMCRVETGFPNFGLGGIIKKGHVVSVAVVHERRRKGIGEALVIKAMENMQSHYGAKQCFLEVRVTNDSAVELYKKLGFETGKTIHGYYADGENAYMMSKKL
jgi:ribosomal-protein-alanine N-acetyltransferase